MEFETFTPIKEDPRIKSKTILEKTGNIGIAASVLFNLNSTTSSRLDLNFKTMFKTMFKTVFKIVFKIVLKIVFKAVFKPMFKIMFKTVFEKKKMANKKHVILKLQLLRREIL